MSVEPLTISLESVPGVGQLYMQCRVFYKLGQYCPLLEVVCRVIGVVLRVIMEVPK